MLTRLACLAFALWSSLAAAQVARVSPPTREEVRAALAQRREHNLEAFRGYIAKGIYPHNTYRAGPLNVWRDENGHLCAAATMISKDGHDELAQDTAKDNNNIRLLDVTKGELLDWMLTSGFTIEEIDQIQEPGFMPVRVEPTSYKQADAKLKRGYTATVKYLKVHAVEDLDTATDRLMQNPDLALRLIEGE